MLKPCAFDLVTDVSRRFAFRRRARSNAKRMMRSVPWRVNIADCTATSCGAAGVEHAADLRVLPFGVLADDDEVDVARPPCPRAGTRTPG